MAARVDKYIRRLEAGNFAAVKALREGVFEIRMNFGSGYRVYYGREGRAVIILLGGGNKRRQAADIALAVQRWRSYKHTNAKNGTDSRLQGNRRGAHQARP